MFKANVEGRLGCQRKVFKSSRGDSADSRDKQYHTKQIYDAVGCLPLLGALFPPDLLLQGTLKTTGRMCVPMLWWWYVNLTSALYFMPQQKLA